jgi:GNAT superfamily N-acetyltransferase
MPDTHAFSISSPGLDLLPAYEVCSQVIEKTIFTFFAFAARSIVGNNGEMHVSREVAIRIERTQGREQAMTAEGWAARHPTPLPVVEEVAGGLLICPYAASPITKAEGLGLAGPVTGSDFDRVEAFFRERGAVAHVTLSPFVDPSLFEILGERGYRLEEMEQVLARTVDPTERFAPPPPGVEIARVADDERATWARVVAQGFAEREEVTDDEIRVGELVAAPEAAELWLARVDGEPAGAGAICFVEGVASLYGTSTRVAFRGRGVQTALLNARLRRAVEESCDLAIVMTAAGSQSQRNVERAGFRVAYT